MARRLEVEVKVPLDCNELPRIEKRLRSLGAHTEGPVVEEDIYMLHPCRDVVARDEAIRLRITAKGARLAYKGPRRGGGSAKSRVEIEVDVDPAIIDVLEALGFREGLRVVKRRIYATLPQALVTMDRVEELGCFVEVESIHGDEAEVNDALRLLGLDDRPRITESYASMLARQRRLPYSEGYESQG